MRIADPPVVADIEAYAALAAAIAGGGRPDLAAQLRDGAREQLYGDGLAIAQMHRFLSAAVEAAARNERLPAGWAP
jgi:hypothetical protein